MTRFTFSLSVALAITFGLQQVGRGQEDGKSLLSAAYQKTQSAKTVTDFSDVVDLCQQAEATSLTEAQSKYVRQLASWAYNKRGEAYVDQAATALESGDKERAAELDTRALANFEQAVDNDLTRWKAIHNRGVSYALAGRYESSIKDFTRVIELRPDYPNAWFNRAEIQYELAQFDKAISDYTKTIELTPDDFGAYTSRGHAHFEQQKFTAALDDYTAAIDLDRSNAEAFVNRGDAYQKLAEWKEAASDFRTAVEIDPQLSRGYASAAWLMVTCPDKQYRNAELGLQAAKRAIELRGNADFELLDTLAAALANADRFNDAAKAVSQAIELAPEESTNDLNQRLDLYTAGKAYRQSNTQTAQAQSATLR